LNRGLLTALIRLYHREADWDGSSWGTRPDTTGPYYKRAAWSETPRIEQALINFLNQADDATKKFAVFQFERHRVSFKGLPVWVALADPQWKQDAESLAKAMDRTSHIRDGDIGGLDPDTAIGRALKALEEGRASARRGRQLFDEQGCSACHVTGRNDPPKGPNLFDVATRYTPKDIMASIVMPSAVVAQGFPTNVIETQDGQSHAGFVIRESGEEIVVRNMAALTEVIPTSAVKSRRKEEKISSMPPGLANNLTPEELASLVVFFQKLK
jgi:putative heme-binding domain-containing protein